MAEMTSMQKVLLVAGFLITGSINTMTKKWQFQSCGPTTYQFNRTADWANYKCPHDDWKHFHKPWFQNIQMFCGEALVFGIFLARKPGRASAARELGKEPSSAPFYIFLLPACCDILGTGVGGVGMLFISASVWQMMRGSLMIFATVWSVIFLGKKQGCHTWIAVMVCAFGLSLIGLSAIADEDPDNSASQNVPLGIFLTVISQAFAAFQMVVEEKLVKGGYEAPPEQVVGSEGLWGIIMMIIILFVMFWIPGSDALSDVSKPNSGSYENALDSMHMLFGSSQLLIFVGFYLVSISFFNFFGVTISGKLSAVHRTVNDALRTMIIWTFEIIVYYGISEEYGTAWKAHTWLQLVGFALLILGNVLKNKIVLIPGINYEEEQAPAPKENVNRSIASSQGGTSLIPQDGLSEQPGDAPGNQVFAA